MMVEPDERSSLAALPPFIVAVAAAASAAAGLVHATAAGTHTGDSQLVLLFALTAVAQVGWAATAVFRPTRVVLIVGAVLNGACAMAWALSRTVGLPILPSLAEPEEIGTQDLIAAALGAVAAGAAAIAWVRGFAPRSRPVPVFLAGAALFAVAVPAMAVEHTHGSSHAHGHGDEAAATASDAHTHGSDELAAEADHGHADVNGGSAADTAAGPIISVDDPRVNANQRAAAQSLIDTTRAAMVPFPDQAAVEAAGYRSIGDAVTGHEHFVNPSYLADPAVLDPARVESIVFEVRPDGTKQVVSAMYILPPGQTMADVPDVAGELTTWHDHQNLCWEGGRVVGLLVNGTCTAGTFQPTPPMLHVWLVENPCGPFAGIEGHGRDCGHGH